jgi:hypothetical protein
MSFREDVTKQSNGILVSDIFFKLNAWQVLYTKKMAHAIEWTPS